MAESRTMKLAPSRPPVDATQLGQLMSDAEVADLLRLDDPTGEKARRWVRARVPGKKRIGQRTVRWFKHEVLAWVAQQ